jgi:hypothetical protein
MGIGGRSEGCGASNRNRTGTPFRATDFKSVVSTDFTIEAGLTLCLAVTRLKDVMSNVKSSRFDVLVNHRLRHHAGQTKSTQRQLGYAGDQASGACGVSKRIHN